MAYALEKPPMRTVRRRMPGSERHGPHLVAAVDQPVVDLVAVDEQIVANGDAGDLVLDFGGRTAPVGLHG
jgi:hypothetical protein